MSKKLNDIKKNQPFHVPEGYFDSLEDRIMDKVQKSETEAQKPKVIGLNPWVKYAAAAAVALIAVFFLVKPGNNTGTISAEEILADVSEDAIIEYLALTDITAGDIINMAEFTEADADSLGLVEPLDFEMDSEDIDLMIEEYGLIDLDTNKL